ncbi:protein of unknown function [Methylocella tundrae]|uniref:Uncharacterized protein n=1 Tax=Methylocella tundrae TaxID=227605 RepID=A0A4U8YWP4_METTU|nr:protein of unknown function [Methylocella tundrae]
MVIDQIQTGRETAYGRINEWTQNKTSVHYPTKSMLAT